MRSRFAFSALLPTSLLAWPAAMGLAACDSASPGGSASGGSAETVTGSRAGTSGGTSGQGASHGGSTSPTSGATSTQAGATSASSGMGGSLAGSGGVSSVGGAGDAGSSSQGASGGEGDAGAGGSQPSTAGGGAGGTAGATQVAGGGAGGSLAGAGGAASGASVDVFGITQLYPSPPGGAEWTSEHWSGGSAYAISSRQDGSDPSGLSGMRGTGTLSVTGDGDLVMGGSQPRIYVYPPESAPWKNVEVTVYYQRVEDAGTAWAGLVIGARSGEEGHGDTPCDAHTYYSRLRHDGAIDFEKELMHSPSATRSRVAPETVWPPDGVLPSGVWIGWKYVIYNTPGDASVRFEAYRDMSGGENGGTWDLVNEAEDAGGWFTQTSCAEHSPVDGESDLVWTAGGTTFIRNTDVTEARYRWLTIREITPP